jgi:hypothetical protein
MHSIRQWIRGKPLTTVLLAIVVFAIARTIASFVPVRELQTLPGFEQAAASLTDPTAFVVLSPPEQTAALDRIPRAVPASDGMPPSEGARSKYSSITLITPRGGSLPLPANENRRTFGDVDVVRYSSGERVLFDLGRDLAQVRVTLRGEPEIVCDTNVEGGIGCRGRPAWNHVGPKQLRVRGKDWPGTWTHPVTGYGLELALGERPLGDALLIEAAFDDAATGHGATVDIDVRVGDSERHFVKSTAPGVETFTAPTTRGARAQVFVTLRTADDAQRHLGMRLRLVEATQ